MAMKLLIMKKKYDGDDIPVDILNEYCHFHNFFQNFFIIKLKYNLINIYF